jgi:hypothetical protein
MGAVRALNEHMEEGTGSISEFKLKSNTFKEDIKPTTKGIVPVKRLLDSSKYCSCVSLPNEVGILPEIRTFLFAFNVSKLLKLPNVDGRGPLNEFPLITNEISDTTFPIDGDIVPSTPFTDDKSTTVTNGPEHAIPVQLHTERSGMSPVQDHPLTPLKECVLVAAATSHMASSFGVAVGAAVLGFDVGTPLGCSVGCPEGCSLG